jgi:choline dehydrogenase-like flavoprotein
MRDPSRDPSRDPDVLVIGGGVVGLFCSYHLRRAGASVAVLERGRVGGPQSCSAGNTGFVGTHGATVPVLLDMKKHSLVRLPGQVPGGHRRHGATAGNARRPGTARPVHPGGQGVGGRVPTASNTRCSPSSTGWPAATPTWVRWSSSAPTWCHSRTRSKLGSACRSSTS